MKEKIIKIFKDCEFKITIKGDLRIVYFLDVTFSSHKNTCDPYRNWITTLSTSMQVQTTHQPQYRNCPNPSKKGYPNSRAIKKYLKKEYHLTLML